MLPEAAARGADPEPRKCRLRTSKRNFAGREALAYPQTLSVTETPQFVVSVSVILMSVH
jgi:hypothetical protein